MLGRTFLQEMYVTVDYERRIFSLSQAYPQGGSSSMITIPSPESEESALPTSTGSGGLSTAAYAGIGVGAVVIAVLALVILYAWRKKKWFFSKIIRGEPTEFFKPEMHGNAVPRFEAMDKERAELETVEQMQEVTESRAMPANSTADTEIPGIHALHELPGNDK